MAEKLYSVVIHKATRDPLSVSTGLGLSAAIDRAAAIYDDSKLFSKHGSLSTGVALFVLDDEVASSLELTKDFSLLKTSPYQCGGW